MGLLIGSFLLCTCASGVVFVFMPDSVMVVAGLFAIPNFASGNLAFRCLLCILPVGYVVVNFFIVYFYRAIWIGYTDALMERANAGVSASVLHPPTHRRDISPNALKLLKKFAAIALTLIICGAPFNTMVGYMIVTQQFPDVYLQVLACFIIQLTSVINPILIYNFDARVKRAVREMFPLVVTTLENVFARIGGSFKSLVSRKSKDDKRGNQVLGSPLGNQILGSPLGNQIQGPVLLIDLRAGTRKNNGDTSTVKM